ncbi:MAG: formyltetrahydrofolate deformylase, partial [Alteromonadales bacterium]|nr:formyltetrahydrofolate deformylase [Alteromonadales bacterium]
RIAFDDRNLTVSSSEFVEALDELAKPLAMQYQLSKKNDVPNILIAVSKDDHCLVSLLTKWKSGILPINIVGIISNHQDCQNLSEWHNIPFHYLPVSNETRAVQEEQIIKLMTAHNVDLLVLARYMQILSNDFCHKLKGRAINIHHSFLPSFKGARPYHQAHARGVKVIGA